MSTSPSTPSLLSVNVVESIHAAAVAGKHQRVESTVAGLTDATLPGLVGYLCLRHLHGGKLSLPALPASVLQSPVGIALGHVVCPFGLRTSGRFTPLTQVTHRSVEFFVLRDSADYTGHFYKLFEARWATACDAAGFRSKTSALHLSMSAMTENAVLHAESDAGILVGYQQLDHAVLFTVADLGHRVLGSLRTNPSYAGLEHPRDALRPTGGGGASISNGTRTSGTSRSSSRPATRTTLRARTPSAGLPTSSGTSAGNSICLWSAAGSTGRK